MAHNLGAWLIRLGADQAATELNIYPPWKYLLVVLAVAFGALYTLPNLYPPDFAVQIKLDAASNDLPEEALQRSRGALENAGIPYKDAELQGRQVLLRLATNEQQLLAQEVLKRAHAEAGESHVVALNLAPTTPAWLAAIGGRPMKYGLDLSGGVHFLLEVDVDLAIRERLEQAVGEAKALLRNAGIRYRTLALAGDRIVAGFASDEDRARAQDVLVAQLQDYEFFERSVDAVPTLAISLQTQAIANIATYAISQNLQSLRNRVNELGVSEPLVQRLGNKRIILDLPGIQDSAEAKRIIGKVANLEFRMAASPNTSTSDTEEHIYEGRTVTLEKNIIVTGDRVSNAQTGLDPETNLPQVNITLDGQGGNDMADATRGNVGRQMAIIFKETKTRTSYEEVDGELVEQRTPYETKRLISVATVQAVLGNRFRITGLSRTEASDLALLLRAGALAAPMYIVEERTVGASLGEENIRKGALSLLAGLVAVMLFMLGWYRLFGLTANLALLTNLLLIIAIMSLLGATLTLPGMAGIVLTVGMAVDANVLIFSRIREELRNRPPQAAIQAGFERAFVTIVDANLTTLLVAVILYAIGTGSVKGFAVTLSIGILTSMFTAIVGTRSLVNLIYGGRNLKRLAI